MNSYFTKLRAFENSEVEGVFEIKGIKYLREEFIVSLHSKLIERYAEDEDPIESLRCLISDSLSTIIDCACYYEGEEICDKHDRIMYKAAYLLDGITSCHCFPDGMKRTAFVVMAIFLELNGYPEINTEKNREKSKSVLLQVSSQESLRCKIKRLDFITNWIINDLPINKD